MVTPVLNRSAAWDALLTSAHAWQFCLRDWRAPAVRDRCLSLLSVDERGRYEQIRTTAMREEYLAARALCRTALSGYAGIDPREWRFAARAHGKPAIAAPKRFASLRFNLTHTGGLVICIVSRAGEVGVDGGDHHGPLANRGPVRQPASRLRRGTRCSARPGSAARNRPAARVRSRRSGRTAAR